ncbi:MAG: hypothetical protein FJ308_21940 [Planctomycetes bacterium]|nr:hypothetical protein [Planctomycetota bacterium]
MTIESTISRAAAEIANGRLWRAKEILGSSISTYGYSREVFRAFANVLLQMGDDLEAGKFLLLAVDKPSASELDAINLFLARYEDQSYSKLLATFPAAARLGNRDDYPEFLRTCLSEYGAPQTLVLREMASTNTPNPTYERFLLMGCGLLAFSAIACTIVGALTIVSWLLKTS